jgi:hypothetical protein
VVGQRMLTFVIALAPTPAGVTAAGIAADNLRGPEQPSGHEFWFSQPRGLLLEHEEYGLEGVLGASHAQLALASPVDHRRVAIHEHSQRGTVTRAVCRQQCRIAFASLVAWG